MTVFGREERSGIDGRRRLQQDMMTFDCILLVDGHLSRAAERRLYALIDAHAEGGIGTGIILTSRSPGGSSWFRSAPAQRRLREGGVVWLDPALPQRAELALVLSPSLAGFGRNRPLRLEAAKALVWPIEADMGEGDDPSELRRLAARLQTILDCAVAWAARSDLERRDLARHLTGMTLDPDIWWPPLSPSPVPPQKRPASLETVGRHFGQGFKLDDTGAGEWSEAWRERWPATLVVLGETDLVSGLPMCAPDQDMRIEQGSESRLGAFLDGLDLFVAAGENAGSGRLEEEILEAMAAGVPVIATPRIAERFEGRLPAAEACFLADLALRIASDREGLDAVRKDQAALLEKRHGPGTHVARLRSCLGAKAGEGNRVEIPFVRAGAVRRPGRLLFIADDSPYLEHLPRQLAIARHLQAPLEPYFLAMARDAPLAERLGFSLEYLLPHSSRVYRSLFEEADGWNESLAGHLQELICFLDAKAVVFDGVYPFAGLAEVCTRYPNLPFIWIRRSLWRADAEEGGLNRSGLFDLIVEPGERAEAFDRGPTRKHRERVVATAPVLFGPRCGADRARFELGLEGGRPAVLLRPTIPIRSADRPGDAGTPPHPRRRRLPVLHDRSGARRRG